MRFEFDKHPNSIANCHCLNRKGAYGGVVATFFAVPGDVFTWFVAIVLFQSFSYCSLNSETEGSAFKGRHFDHSIILLCVRWYLAYNLSLRNLEEMTAERGIAVDHATIHRWVIRYSPELLERFNRCKRALSCNRCIKEWRSF